MHPLLIAGLSFALTAFPDANHDGKPDLHTIMGILSHLERQGVAYDDRDPGGNVPELRSDGRYHMVCVDLLTVAYRNAGYSFLGRQVVRLREQVMRDPRMKYFAGPDANPLPGSWRPATPMRVGDMVFARYDDTPEYHAGIVSGVDPRTGLPTHVTQISSYTPTGGIHRSTWREFWWLRCRRLMGWARPAAWDAGPVTELERSLTVPAPPGSNRVPVWFSYEGPTALKLRAALAKVRASRGGDIGDPAATILIPDGATITRFRRHATHTF
jgi:hypothetical protein